MVAMLAHTHKHTHTHTSLNTRKFTAAQYTPHCHRNFFPCPFLAPVPVSPAPHWCWLSAELLQEFHRVYLREEKRGKETDREKQKEREQERQRNIRQWNRKMDSNKMKGTMCRKGHTWQRWMRKRGRGSGNIRWKTRGFLLKAIW